MVVCKSRGTRCRKAQSLHFLVYLAFFSFVAVRRGGRIKVDFSMEIAAQQPIPALSREAADVKHQECDAREVMIRCLRRPVFFVQTMEKDRVREQRNAHRHAAGDNPTGGISF
jgi:hypothetical protein